MAEAFAGVTVIVSDRFSAAPCNGSSYMDTHALRDSKACVPYAVDSVSNASNSSAVATILDSGAVRIVYSPGAVCASIGSMSSPSATEVASHACYAAQNIRFYVYNASSSASASTSASSSRMSVVVEPTSSSTDSERGLNTLVFVSMVVVPALLIVAVAVFIMRRRQSITVSPGGPSVGDSVAMLEPEDTVHTVSKRSFLPQSSTCTTYREQITARSFAPGLSSVGSSFHGHRSSRALAPGLSSTLTLPGASMAPVWEDDVVVASRIPRDKVVVQQLLSRGGFGVVYSGLYNGRRVAVKMLLPETRRSISHVADLLVEAKLMAAMEHPHIVEFVGVAWDSLTNMCIVSEFMGGGDLKALLMDFDESGRPTGFSRDKLKIALHVAHALTYMHSLEPAIIHRDLKSKNVLLSERLEAKLTDFGTSRERVNESMTGGVGTCLWMAPEVMVGDKYDDKADMFSFGVVLSEIDTHSSPYSHARDPNDATRPMPEPAILQMVATGKLHVKFSEPATHPIVELGTACVAVDPNARPSASEALYRLHQILTEEVLT